MVSCIGCGEPAELDATARLPVVYGVDDRVQIVDYPNAAVVAAALRTVLAVVPSERWVQGAGGVLTWRAASSGAVFDLCSMERFSEELSVATCTAVLIAPKLAVTARHCVGVPDACQRLSFIAGVRSAGDGGLSASHTNDVYACRNVLVSNSATDVAFIELARSASHAALPPMERAVEVGQTLTLVGFPLGTPMKAAPGTVTRPADGPDGSFNLAVDAFGGTSGGAVLSERGRLSGILVRGGSDFDTDAELGCARARVAPSPGRGDAAEQAVGVDALVAAACESADKDVCETVERALIEPTRKKPSGGCDMAARGRQLSGGYALIALLAVAHVLRPRARRSRASARLPSWETRTRVKGVQC